MAVIDDLSDDEKQIWHTYMYRSRKLTRQSVITLNDPVKLKSVETDNDLECCIESKPANFYESINSIIFSIFTADFRINLAARKRDIYNSKLTKFIDFDDVKYPIKNNNKKNRFKDLSLSLKWRNFPFACGIEENIQYLESVKKLKNWITLRNDIAHANYKKLSEANVTPQKALDCYESVVDSIFELNIILGFDRKEEERKKKEVSLLP